MCADSQKSGRALGKLFKRVVETLIICVISFVLLEASLRIVPVFFSQISRSAFSEAKRIALSNTRVHNGFRGGTRIALPSAPSGDLLVVGDSIPFGTYVSEESTFPSRLSKKLGLSVINLGTGSQSPPEYNRMLEVGMRYHPKAVLYCIFANDFLYFPEPEIRPLSIDKVNASLSIDGGLFLERLQFLDYLVSAIKRVTNLSLTYQLYKLYQQRPSNVKSVFWKQGEVSFMFAPLSYWEGQISWKNQYVRRGVEINQELVTAAYQLTRSQNIELVVALIPSKEMVYGPLLGDLSPTIYSDSHHQTYRELSRRLGAKGIYVVDVTRYLRSLAMKNIALFHVIDGHLNERGHDEVANFLADPIKIRLLRTRRISALPSGLIQR